MRNLLALGLLSTWLCASVSVGESGTEFRLFGADLSLLPKLEAAGAVFKDAGKPGDVIAFLRARGANCVRLRLFVNPNGQAGVVNDLPYTIALAQRVKAAGMQLYLALHYSDTWADVRAQLAPAAWRNLPFPELVETMEKYTVEVVTAFKDAGVAPDIVQVGNEITNGLLGPATSFEDKGVAQDVVFDRLCALLKAGIRGVHAALGESSPVKIVIHIDNAGKLAVTRWFFDNVTKRQVLFDVIALSYYPFWQGSLTQLQENLIFAAKTYGKPVLVAETAYPWVETEYWKAKENLNFPLTPQGQRLFLEALIATVRAVPHNLGLGVLYWYPESLAVKSPAILDWWDGELSLFDREGNALPAWDAFETGR
jgi:arabinogalactan endo-1,4-beta-galactosidase